MSVQSQKDQGGQKRKLAACSRKWGVTKAAKERKKEKLRKNVKREHQGENVFLVFILSEKVRNIQISWEGTEQKWQIW